MINIKLLLLTLLSICIASFCYSQDLKESTESIGEITGNALSVKIVRADKKDIEREWKSIMKSYDGDVKIKGDQIFTTDAQIESISSGNVQVNAEIEKNNNNSHQLTVIFMSERGAVSSKDDISGFTAASFILKDLAKRLSIEAATVYKNNEEKKLENLKRKQEDLKKENERLASRIEEYKNRIIESEESIEENKTTLISTAKEIEEQEKSYQQSVEELKSIK